MVELGELPPPLALNAFLMDSKFDLPAALSKLHYTTTKLRPRDGPTLQWRNEFVDLLAINPFTHRNETNFGRPGMIVPDATVRERARPREVVRVS